MNGSLHTTGATRAILAHADPTVREALRDLIVQGLGMEVVGEAGDQAMLRDQVRSLRPELIIVAWKLLAGDAAATLSDLRGAHDEARVVVLGPRPDRRQAALAAGADAYISMVDAPDVVAAALKTQEPGGLS
jgi:DNA-binding NarL/FixJ family response regulator